MAGLSSPRSCGHVQEGSCPPPPPLALKTSLEGSQSLGGPQTLPHTLPSGVKCREHSQSWTGRKVAWSVLSCCLPLCPQGYPSKSRQGWWQQVLAFQRGPGWPGREGTECVNPFMSILSVPAESCRRAPSFEHTHRSHTLKTCTRECTYTLTLTHAEIHKSSLSL